jgi:Na+/H+ antiporter NhaB
VYYDVYEVQQDSFAVYGVYHLVASARVLRDKPEILKDSGGQSEADIYDPKEFS